VNRAKRFAVRNCMNPPTLFQKTLQVLAHICIYRRPAGYARLVFGIWRHRRTMKPTACRVRVTSRQCPVPSSAADSRRDAFSTKARPLVAIEASRRAASIRVAGRWPLPVRREMANVVPCPTVLTTSIVLRCNKTNCCTRTNPMPEPS
jgi:hypothetical protein